MKICTKCNQLKDIKEFGKLRNGLNYWCKQCNRGHSLAYKKTIRGLLNSMYNHQKTSSKRRKHILPNYSFEIFYLWALEKPELYTLFNLWVKSNYNKNSIPSVDRLNDNLPYTLSNIQLMTWGENNEKGKSTHLAGKLGVHVDKLDLQNNFIKTYPNLSIPAKELNCSMGEISRVCKGRRNTCRNFKWRYTNE